MLRVCVVVCLCVLYANCCVNLFCVFAWLFASLFDTNVCVVCDVSCDVVCACMFSMFVCVGVCGLKIFVCVCLWLIV